MELNPLLSNIIVVLAIITGLAVGIWWIISLYFMHTRKSEDDLPEVELPGDLHEVVAGIPAALVVFYAFILVSLVGYVVYIWLGGITY